MNRSTVPEPPLTRFYDLSDLSEAGDEVTIAAKADDLPRLAAWLGVDAVEQFVAVVTLRRLAANRFLYEAAAQADILQTCVVSLRPVKSHLAFQISRALQLADRRRRAVEAEAESGGVVTLSIGEEEGPEDLDSPHYDLAVPVLEETVLRIDPYPRAEGVEFEPISETATPRENPFAVLKQLKERR